jgi:hypothetical protein
MAAAARAQGRPDAAAAIVDDLIAWIGGPPQTAARVPVYPRNRRDPECDIVFARVELAFERGRIGAQRRPLRPLARFEPVAAPARTATALAS